MRPLSYLIVVGMVAVSFAGCASDDASDATTTTSALTTTMQVPTTATKVAPPTTTHAPTTTIEVTTTTADPARLPEPAAMEQLVRGYCSAWPAIAEYLTEDVSLVDVSGTGWDSPGKSGAFCKVPDVDEGIVQGRSDVRAALSASELSLIDCGGPAVVSGDLIALPVSASRQDGTGEEGIWVFRIVENQIQWLLNYGTDVDQVSPAATGPEPSIATQAGDFCALYGGTGYRRSSDDVIAAMSDEPAIQNIPHGLHCMGVSGIKTDVGSYYPADIIGCEDVTTNGQWSAQVSTIHNLEFDLGLVGILVRQHVDGQIHRQYNHYTQLSGFGDWGFQLNE